MRLPRARFNFSVSGTELEGGCDEGDDPNGVCCLAAADGHCLDEQKSILLGIWDNLCFQSGTPSMSIFVGAIRV